MFLRRPAAPCGFTFVAMVQLFGVVNGFGPAPPSTCSNGTFLTQRCFHCQGQGADCTAAHPGGRNSTATTPEACCAACSESSTCTMWTLTDAVCYLKVWVGVPVGRSQVAVIAVPPVWFRQPRANGRICLEGRGLVAVLTR